MAGITRIWKVPCPRCGCHVDVNLDEGLKLFEVSDPIVWDGTDEAFERVRNAFEGTANYASLDDNPSAGWGHGGCLWIGVGQESSMVPSGWRIQIVGDSFVILPPAKGGE